MSVSSNLLCSFELLKPLDSSALKSHIKRGRNARNNMLNSPVCSSTSFRNPRLTCHVAGPGVCPELLGDAQFQEQNIAPTDALLWRCFPACEEAAPSLPCTRSLGPSAISIRAQQGSIPHQPMMACWCFNRPSLNKHENGVWRTAERRERT